MTLAVPLSDRLPRVRLGVTTLLLIVALYLALTQNLAFWHHVFDGLPGQHSLQDYGLIGSLFVALMVLLLLVMLPISFRAVAKPGLALLLVTASLCSYFMDSFGVVIDESMLVNALQTNVREASELLGFKMLLHVGIFGFLPALLLTRVTLVSGTRTGELLRRLTLLGVMIAVLAGCVLANYKSVTLWVRAHREVRLYANPSYPLYSLVGELKHQFFKIQPKALKPVALDAKATPAPHGKPRVVIMVVGETARAANFQLAGYARATNPELATVPDLVSFTNVWSCGTATAISVPCMFSNLGRKSFSRSKARERENLLDVLQRAGVQVLWRDNNSDCKGVCARVPTEDLRRVKDEALCDTESCRDEVLLRGLDEIITGAGKDQFIVLHLLGSHGPSYYKRYPEAFRRFTPDCAQDEVQNCSQESIVNAYDNTMLYTDHVLALLIQTLQRHQDVVEPGLIYLSDHGESLGEDGIYLHGLPYAVAPDEQKHVPMVVWSPAVDSACLAARKDQSFSHDNLFHSALGLMAVQTSDYQPEQDLFKGCLKP